MPVEKIPGLERLLLPAVNGMKGDIKTINARIDSPDGKIDSLRNETKTEISSVRNEIISLRKGLQQPDF